MTSALGRSALRAGGLALAIGAAAAAPTTFGSYAWSHPGSLACLCVVAALGAWLFRPADGRPALAVGLLVVDAVVVVLEIPLHVANGLFGGLGLYCTLNPFGEGPHPELALTQFLFPLPILAGLGGVIPLAMTGLDPRIGLLARLTSHVTLLGGLFVRPSSIAFLATLGAVCALASPLVARLRRAVR